MPIGAPRTPRAAALRGGDDELPGAEDRLAERTADAAAEQRVDHERRLLDAGQQVAHVAVVGGVDAVHVRPFQALPVAAGGGGGRGGGGGGPGGGPPAGGGGPGGGGG